jgi:hypothetical protein
MSDYAQDLQTLEKTYIYYAPQTESLEQAKRTAVNRAKVEALRERFGSIVSGASAMSLITKNHITQSKFVSLSSEGEVNGEWIADIETPKVKTTLGEMGLIVEATVKGKARELPSNAIDFSAKILRNTPDARYESSEFMVGDYIFAHFMSSVDGYLAVYLLDGETAYCLLPYDRNKEGKFHINHGEEYILFNFDNYSEDEDPMEIKQYRASVEGQQQDLNQIYFIFSPNEFTKALDKYSKDEKGKVVSSLPRNLSWEDFQKWIIRVRRNDNQMAVQIKNILISPQN